MTETVRTTDEQINGKLDEATAHRVVDQVVAEHTSEPPIHKAKRRGRQRILTAFLTMVAAALICSIGAVLGYTQGPSIATLLASGQNLVQIGTEFQPCFTAASNDEGVRSFFRLFFGNRNRPTATPGPRPTIDPTLARVVRGTLIDLGTSDLTVQAEGGQSESLAIFPLMQIVSDTGNRISRKGLLAGDLVRVLAVRSGALGPFGGAQPTTAPESTPQPPNAGAYAALCVIVDVSPASPTASR